MLDAAVINFSRCHMSATSRPTAMATVRAIVREIRLERQAGRGPSGIVLTPELADRLRGRAFRYLWSDSDSWVLLGFPTEVDPNATRWRLRFGQDRS